MASTIHINSQIDALLQQAAAHHLTGRLHEAEQLYRAILQSDPRHTEANHNLGVLAIHANQPNASQPYFRTALESRPNRIEFWWSYIDALIQAGENSVARQVMAQGQQQGLSVALIAAFELRIDQPGENEPGPEQTDLLVALINQKQYARAAILAQMMTLRHPRSGVLWKVLGAALQMEGIDAIPALQKSADLLPDDASAQCNLGAALQTRGRLHEAIVSYRRALEINADFSVGHNNLGVALQALGQMDDAAAAFTRALELQPDYAEAHRNMGTVLQGRGLLDAAVTSYRRALEIEPNHAEAHDNLGVALHALGNLDGAVESFGRALKVMPDFAHAHNNLGVSLQYLGRHEEAMVSFRRALELDSDFAEASFNLGNVLSHVGQYDAAAASYRRALDSNPQYAAAHGGLGDTFRKMGKLDEALACYRHQVRLSPENSVARHHIASLSGENTERAPVEYVESVFDKYADKFDAHLQQVLRYDIPERLVIFLKRHSTPPARKWSILDLGCGTGLAGLAIGPYAKQLVGVDLSAKMLEKARARRLYHRLERLDLLGMMEAENAESYDVIVAADVFVYLGELSEIVGQVRRLLLPGGTAVFSIELPQYSNADSAALREPAKYKLESTGRYSHAPEYISSLALSCGFLRVVMEDAQIRTERGKPVSGKLVLLQG